MGQDGDVSELVGDSRVNDVLEASEAGVAYTLLCEEHDVGRIRADMLRSDRWTALDDLRNGGNSYVRVAYTSECLNQ